MRTIPILFEADGIFSPFIKVWSKTPGLGESPFLECLWSSIDEVGGA